MMPKISVIVPVYNVEQYLPQCLDSIINQTYKNLEIICVDDGSPDNSGKILDEYAKKDKRIKVIHQENGGLSVARNTGLDNATGEWVSFIDSDDYIKLDFYENLISAANKSGADVVQCGFYLYDEAVIKEIKYPTSLFCSYSDILKQIKKCYVWNKLWKREFIKKHNLKFTPKIYFEDVLFTVTAIPLIIKWENLNYVGYYYRYNPNSITNDPKKIKKRSEDRYYINNSVLTSPNISEHPFYAELKDFLAKHLIDANELMDPQIRSKYKKIFGDSKIFSKKCIKAYRRYIFSVSIKLRKIIIFGKQISFKKENPCFRR